MAILKSIKFGHFKPQFQASKALRLVSFAALTGLFAAHSLSWLEVPVLTALERRLYDARIFYSAPAELDPRIVIVDIDEKSLQEQSAGGEGHWPWPRNRIANLFEKIFDEQGAALLGVDFIFSEQDKSSGLQVLENLAQQELKGNKQFAETLQKIAPSLDYDAQFAKQIAKGKVVLGAAFHNLRLDQKPAISGGILPEALTHAPFAVHTYPAAVPPLGAFQAAASAVGHLNPLRDQDGITRRVPMLIEFDHKLYPALSLAMLQALTGEASIESAAPSYFGSYQKIESLRVGGIDVPVDKDLNALVPYRQAKKTFTYISAVDLLHGALPEKSLENKIVLLGSSATGLADYVSSPLGVTLPGVQVHANMLSGMLDERIPAQPNFVAGIDFLSVLLCGLLMSWASFKLRPSALMLTASVLAISLVALNWWALIALHMLVPLAAPLGCVLGMYLFQASYGYFVESRAKKQVTDMFSSYVPPDLVQVIAQNPEAFNMNATEKNLSVLFVNIREFSAIAEKLAPHDLAEWINLYLSMVSDIVSVQHKGTLDKYMGDSVMAFWGAPLPDDDHAEHAVNAALQIKQSAEQLNYTYRQRGWPTAALSIGVNTGLMRVGDMGSNIRRAYTVMGDAVNIAAKIQSLTGHYGVDILMGSDTAAKLQLTAFRSIDCVKFTGRRQVIELLEPIAKKVSLTPEAISEIEKWQKAVELYRREAWREALEMLHNLTSEFPSSFLYALYARRVQAFMDNPTLIAQGKSFKVPPRSIQHFLRPAKED